MNLILKSNLYNWILQVWNLKFKSKHYKTSEPNPETPIWIMEVKQLKPDSLDKLKSKNLETWILNFKFIKTRIK